MDWDAIYCNDESLSAYLQQTREDFWLAYNNAQKMSNAPEVSPFRRIRLREAANYLFESTCAICNVMTARDIAFDDRSVNKEEQPTDNYAATCAVYAAVFDRLIVRLHERQLDKRAPHDVYGLHNILLKKAREIQQVFYEGTTSDTMEFARRELGEDR